VCAAHVHDLGKMGQYHLTALNCSEYDGHKAAAQKVAGVPARLLEPVRLAPEVAAAVDHMYERYDGKGFPDGQAGKDIPLGARVLAICDTYADLTQNPRNPYRKMLSANEACAALSKHGARRGPEGEAAGDALAGAARRHRPGGDDGA
jgi:response regulator RpfG family c-di-GMP phosphodiesterase